MTKTKTKRFIFICKVCNKPTQKNRYYSPFVSDKYERVHIKCKPKLIESLKSLALMEELEQ